MIIVLLLQMMGGWDGGGWFIYVWVWVEGQWVSYFTFCSYFVLLLIVL